MWRSLKELQGVLSRDAFLASWARVFAFEAELVAAMTALSIFSSNSLQAELLKLLATREQLPE